MIWSFEGVHNQLLVKFPEREKQLQNQDRLANMISDQTNKKNK